MKKSIYLVSIILLSSCRNNNFESQKSNDENKKLMLNSDSTNVSNSDFILDYFKKIPDTIDGCGEFYTFDSIKFEDKKFIFISNLSDFGIIRVNNKDVYLGKDQYLENENSSLFENNEFKVLIDLKQTKQYDEGGFYKGTIEITNKNNKSKYHFHIHGESGC